MTGMEQRGVDGGLEVQPLKQVTQQHAERPLLLLIAAGGADPRDRPSVAGQHRRGQGGARPSARGKVRRQALVEPEHLAAGW